MQEFLYQYNFFSSNRVVVANLWHIGDLFLDIITAFFYLYARKINVGELYP